uniref:NADH dehydrogenase subunit 6 n=1 Tax=Binodoxys communis TaxID=556335 RepID=UPI0022FD3CAE|nr:NADH dehydrogenase subunit 6 [Binodoxys communis]WAL07397.1 NADH dehydrogenase subunit 6 [Binodoxys communis]
MMNFYLMFFIFNIIMFILMMIPSNLIKFHPLILSLMLTLYVIILSLFINLLGNNYWYSYLLFLVMIGGLMILFMYFTSIASNELMNFNKSYLLYFFIKILLFMGLFLIFSFYSDKMLFMNNFLDIYSMNYYMLNLKDFGIKNLYMDFSMDLNMYMILYLFFTMISCVLVCMKLSVPFRQLNYYE